jgi:sugar-specific transcriptional regulator TrmB
VKAEEILKGLVEIRLARRAKFVPYDLDRRLKRKESELWDMAEKLHKIPVPAAKKVATGT